MIREIHFVCQLQAEKIAGRPDVVVVSIRSPHPGMALPPKLQPGFRDVLALKFDDFDHERDGMDALAVPFSAAQADTLRHWLASYHAARLPLTLLVHCHAGISRSAAVAWWAHHTVGAPLRTRYPVWHLNRHVLRLLNPNLAPPERPAHAPAVPAERAFESPPQLAALPLADALVVFAHGKESGPQGGKIRLLRQVAERLGATTMCPDFTDLTDPEARVRRLCALPAPPGQRLILAGSSMGGYVVTVASRELKPEALFLMAPAFGLPGYAEPQPVPQANAVCVVHGWQDEVIPAQNAIRFAEAHGAELHLLQADHRLGGVLPELGQLFEGFLLRLASDDSNHNAQPT